MSELEARERLLASAGLEGIYEPPGSIVLDTVLTAFDRHNLCQPSNLYRGARPRCVGDPVSVAARRSSGICPHR
jgi:hypothetical protein